jgi:dynein heavy chain, axonemal
LSTLERHFKTISVQTFGMIAETMLPMLNALRMVWVISRHFNTDEKMVPLMERIATELADVCETYLGYKSLLKQPPEEIKSRASAVKTVLDRWYEV